MNKTTLLIGLATGYVLGTRDGRERYEQIKTKANGLWNDPRVQEKASMAQDLAKEKAPQVQAKVSQAAHKATDKAKSKSKSDGKTSDPHESPEVPPMRSSTETAEPALSTQGPRPTPGDVHG
ncbi:MAG: YtxH domain-containing protein [Nocardioidaceae bacterium]